jgi:hypothetical protein
MMVLKRIAQKRERMLLERTQLKIINSRHLFEHCLIFGIIRFCFVLLL